MSTPIPPATTAPKPALSPVERLALSRLAMGEVLLAAAIAAAPSPGESSMAGAAGAAWRAALHNWPGAELLVGVLRDWWDQHPAQALLSAVAQAAQAALRPLARRHPFALMAGAALAGAVLARTRPWRWLSAALPLAGTLGVLLKMGLGGKATPSWAEAIHWLARATQAHKKDRASAKASMGEGDQGA